MTLDEAFRTLYQPQQLRSASPKTLALWRVALRHFDRFLSRRARLPDLTNASLSAFAAWRLQGVQPATVNRDLASLLALWRWLHRRGYIDRWPDVQLEHEPRRIPQAWTREEFSRLFAAAQRAPGNVGRAEARVYWPALLLVLFDSGERIGAVLALRWADVDIAGRWVLFRAEHRKGRDQDSCVRLAEDTCRWLARLPRSQAPFAWPHSYVTIWARYGELLAAAGLPTDRQSKFHRIRRTTVSHAEAAGGNATELLRHASRRNTLAYLDPRILQPRQAIDWLWRPTD